MRIIHENLSEQEIIKLKEKRAFSPKKLLFLPTIFWIAALLEFTLGGSWTSFLHIHAYVDFYYFFFLLDFHFDI